MKKVILIALGFLFLSLGTLGLLLPVLPTTPFLLLTLACFAKGSERFHNWFVGSRMYQKHLAAFAQGRGMTMKHKLFIVIPVSVLLLFIAILSGSLPLRIFLAAVLLAKYYCFFFRIRTIPAAGKEAAPLP